MVPPSRWLLILTVVIVVGFTVLRIWLAATFDLRTDEAYYWTWARQWVPGYLDHPPMVAWFVKFGQPFFGDTTLGARFGQILALPVIEFFLADIARRRSRSWNAALFVMVLLESTVYYSLIVIILEPSVPMLVFLSMMLWSLCRLDESMDGRWWLLAGLAGGLALLSKLLIALVAPALLIFLLLSPRHRHWFATRWPWLGLGVAVLVCLPFLLWNARHGWPTFAFQAARLGSGGLIGTLEVEKFVAFETICAGFFLVPIAVVQGVRLASRSLLQRRAFEAMVATAFVVPIAYFFLKSFNTLILMSWAYFAWPLGFLSLALTLSWGTRWVGAKVIIALALIPSAVFTALIFYQGISGPIALFGNRDLFAREAGYADLSVRVLQKAKENGAKWIATTDYNTYVNLYWHIRDAMPIVQVTQRARYIDFAPLDPAQFVGRALYVHELAAPHKMDGTNRTPLGTIPIVWRGKVQRDVTVELLDNYAPDLSAPDQHIPSATYTWD
jgi:4-amino-4-deoxy-L-arabinose transferase-like glycosyltransferase